jgi:hypothetical protein
MQNSIHENFTEFINTPNSHYDIIYNSDYFSDSDDEDENILIYNPDEPNVTKYCIALCELHNKIIHGNTNSIAKYNYIVNTRFKQFSIKLINDYANFINNKYLQLSNLDHDIFKNYRNILQNNNYIKPEIIEYFYIDDYCIAILKTIWIRLIQRRWKNIIIKKKEILIKRKRFSSLLYREINGNWPQDCLNYPTLKGMLYNLKFTTISSSSKAITI